MQMPANAGVDHIMQSTDCDAYLEAVQVISIWNGVLKHCICRLYEMRLFKFIKRTVKDHEATSRAL